MEDKSKAPAEEQGIEDVVSKTEEAFVKLPLLYKRLITRDDYLMLLGGLKAVSDYSFLETVFEEENFNKLKSIFISIGLRVTEPKIQNTKRGLRRWGYIYNPKTLRRETLDSTLVPPYDPLTDIFDYIDQTLAKGVNPHILYGKLYSFPESAISDFVHQQVQTDREDTNLISQSLAKWNETYLYYEPPKEDILAREADKDKFFRALEVNSRFKKIIESDELIKSDREWHQRIQSFFSKNTDSR